MQLYFKMKVTGSEVTLIQGTGPIRSKEKGVSILSFPRTEGLERWLCGKLYTKSLQKTWLSILHFLILSPLGNTGSYQATGPFSSWHLTCSSSPRFQPYLETPGMVCSTFWMQNMSSTIKLWPLPLGTCGAALLCRWCFLKNNLKK